MRGKVRCLQLGAVLRVVCCKVRVVSSCSCDAGDAGLGTLEPVEDARLGPVASVPPPPPSRHTLPPSVAPHLPHHPHPAPARPQ